MNIDSWLMDNADPPIRYGAARTLLRDDAMAGKIEGELLGNPTVRRWLNHLKPETPPQHRSMTHGSFDFCLENAALKGMQLGLHGGLAPVAEAASYFLNILKSKPPEMPLRNRLSQGGFDNILIANLLSAMGVEDAAVRDFLLGRLAELHAFTQRGGYDIYYTPEERAALKGIPKIWTDKQVIRLELVDTYGYCYPLIYDLLGLHTLYSLGSPQISGQVDAVIEYISTDGFHRAIADGYGILVSGKRVYHDMGWDPKYPGWFDPAGYLEGGYASRLLFFALHIAKYPGARGTKWFREVRACLEKYRRDSGTYLFPAGWLDERQGYAVIGNHVSFGENRRKRNWREVESTYYMRLLEG